MINRLFLSWKPLAHRPDTWTCCTLYGSASVSKRLAPWYLIVFKNTLWAYEARFKLRHLGWYKTRDEAVQAVSHAAIRLMNETLRRNAQ